MDISPSEKLQSNAIQVKTILCSYLYRIKIRQNSKTFSASEIAMPPRGIVDANINANAGVSAIAKSKQ